MKTALIVLLLLMFLHPFAQQLNKYPWQIELDKEKIFSSLNEALHEPLKVKRLDLSNQDFEIFPPEIFQLTELVELNLYRNKLTSIPEQIGALTKLKVLLLSYNKINWLPESLGKLTELKQIIIWGNLLDSLPHTLGNLKKLEVLELYDNQLKILPVEFGNLDQLKVLNLGVNPKLNHEQAFSVLKNLKLIENLNYSNNFLKALPSTIGQITTLTVFEAVNNELTTLPPEIGKLRRLQKLILGEARGSYNRINHLPAEFGNLLALTELYLSNNRFDSIPLPVCKLYRIKILDMSYNSISYIPVQIGNLKNVENVNLSHNKIKNMPSSIKNWKNNKEFIRYDNPISLDDDANIVSWLSKKELSKADSLDVEQNYRKIESIVFELLGPCIPNPENITINLQNGKLTCIKTRSEVNLEKQMTPEDFRYIQKTAYRFAFQLYGGISHTEGGLDCVGGSTSRIIINGTLKYGHDGCQTLEFEEEFGLLVKKMLDQCK